MKNGQKWITKRGIHCAYLDSVNLSPKYTDNTETKTSLKCWRARRCTLSKIFRGSPSDCCPSTGASCHRFLHLPGPYSDWSFFRGVGGGHISVGVLLVWWRGLNFWIFKGRTRKGVLDFHLLSLYYDKKLSFFWKKNEFLFLFVRGWRHCQLIIDNPRGTSSDYSWITGKPNNYVKPSKAYKGL